MVVRFENLWISVPLMLIPISFAILMMGLIRVWMFSAPTRIRRKPKYSMHVMKQLKEAQGYYGRKASVGGGWGGGGGGLGQKVNRQQSYGGETPDDVIKRPLGFGGEDPLPPPPPAQSSSGFATPGSRYSYDYR